MTGVVIRRGRDTEGKWPCEDTEIQGKCYVKTEAEIGVMLPQVKECLRLPEARRGKKISCNTPTSYLKPQEL